MVTYGTQNPVSLGGQKKNPRVLSFHHINQLGYGDGF